MKTDQQLLQTYIKQNSQTAFREIVSRNGKMVYSACYRILQDSHLAEDATQEVFLILAKKASTFKPDVILGGWLYNSAVWEAKNLARSRTNTQRRERRTAMEAEKLHDSNDSEEILWQEISHYLDDALSTLPKRLEEALILCFLQEIPRSEAAKLLGCTENTLSKRINRALNKLNLSFIKKGITAPIVTLTAILSTRTTEVKAASFISSLSQSMVVPTAIISAQVTATSILATLTTKVAITCLAVVVVGTAAGYTLYQTPEIPEMIIVDEKGNLEAQHASLIAETEGLRETIATLKQTKNELESRLNKYTEKETEINADLSEKVESMVQRKLKVHKAIMVLTPEQERQISQWHWDSLSYWMSVFDGIVDVNDPSPMKTLNTEEKIKTILTDEQLMIYEAHLIKEDNETAETHAAIALSDYPITVSLSDEQKDALYQKLYQYEHRDSNDEILERYNNLKNKQFEQHEQMLIWAAEDVISEEQMEILMDSFIQSK